MHKRRGQIDRETIQNETEERAVVISATDGEAILSMKCSVLVWFYASCLFGLTVPNVGLRGKNQQVNIEHLCCCMCQTQYGCNLFLTFPMSTTCKMKICLFGNYLNLFIKNYTC